MQWLEGELRKTGTSHDRLTADIISDALTHRGEDIPLPQRVEQILPEGVERFIAKVREGYGSVEFGSPKAKALIDFANYTTTLKNVTYSDTDSPNVKVVERIEEQLALRILDDIRREARIDRDYGTAIWDLDHLLGESMGDVEADKEIMKSLSDGLQNLLGELFYQPLPRK